MSTNKTNYFQLHSWANTDLVDVNEINQNFTTIDTKLHDLDIVNNNQDTRLLNVENNKSDKTTVTALDTRVANVETNKSDKTTVSAIDTRVGTVETTLSSKKLIGQYDTPAKLPTGASVGDTALVLNPLSLYMFGRKMNLGSTDAIPQLNGNAYTPAGSSGMYYITTNATYTINQPYRLFNNTSDSYFANSTPCVFPITITMDLPAKQVFSGYTLQARNLVTNDTPKSWQLLGSNDKQNWDVLDTRSSEPAWSALEKRTFKFRNAKSYEYYQLSVSENHNGIGSGQAGNLVLDEMEFFEATFDWGVYDNNLYIEPSQFFQNYGLSGIDLRNSDLVGLNSLYFADSADNSALEGINFLKTGKPTYSIDGTHYDNLKLLDGYAYVNGKKLIDMGNIVADRFDLKSDFTLPAAAQYYNINWGAGQSYTSNGNWSESTNQFTVPKDGIYRVFVTLQFKGCTAGNHYYARLWNATSSTPVYLGQVTAGGSYIQIVGELQGLLAKGDKYQIEVYSSAGTPSLDAGRTRLSITSVTLS